MIPRTRTLRSALTLSTFLLLACLLAASFLGIERLLTRELHRDLQRAAGQQGAFVEAAIQHHAKAGPEALRREILDLADRSGALVLVRRGDETIASRSTDERSSVDTDGTVRGADGLMYRAVVSRVGEYLVVAGLPTTPIDELRSMLVRVMAVALVAALLLGSLLARALASRAVAPLLAVSEAADRIDLGHMGARLSLPRGAHLEVQRLAESFNRMLERLEAAVGRLQQFTADAAHELRTPLATLKTQAETALADGRYAPGAASLIRSQLEEIDRLRDLVADLLILAQLDAGSEVSHGVDLTDLVLEAVERSRPLSEQRGIALRVEQADVLSVNGDAAQLRRALDNLIENALKFTATGGEVAVSLRGHDANARLEIRDSGSGIAPENLPHIFKRFYRADASRSRETGGAGLGLAIVAGIVRAHHGSVEVASEPQKGSRFTIELPLASVDPTARTG